jgi:hypothetical protein
MKHQAGQSMTEFAVGLAVCSLLLLGSITMSGYQEVDRRLVLAARQSAWQDARTAGAMDTRVAAGALHRGFLADVGVLDPSARNLLVRSDEDVSLEAASTAPDGLAGSVATVLLAPLRVAGGFLSSGFDLQEGGLVTGAVGARIAPVNTVPPPFDTLDLQLRVPFALLEDAWNAGGVAHVRSRASGLVPTTRLRTVNAIWRPLSVPLGLVEPTLDQLCLGLIEPDRVPDDRLGPGATPLPRGCP